MKKILKKLHKSIKLLVVEHNAWRRFWRSYRDYKELASVIKDPDCASKLRLDPCIWDATRATEIEPIYFYQDSWAFERIVKNSPSKHYDIGSHHKYVSLLSKIIPVVMVDIRPLSLKINTVHFVKGSILNLPFPDKSIESLSSLCVIEHIGLGRYGDELDPEGSVKACRELSRVISPGGNLYVSVPVESTAATYFNAHRSFREDEFLSLFRGFILKDKVYIYGNELMDSLRDEFGVGCYHLVRSFSDSDPILLDVEPHAPHELTAELREAPCIDSW